MECLESIDCGPVDGGEPSPEGKSTENTNVAKFLCFVKLLSVVEQVVAVPEQYGKSFLLDPLLYIKKIEAKLQFFLLFTID